MTPDALRHCLDTLAWSQRGVAALLAVNEREVRRWAAGRGPIPPAVAAWLALLAAFHERHPPPRRP